jgi:hypothetical protein
MSQTSCLDCYMSWRMPVCGLRKTLYKGDGLWLTKCVCYFWEIAFNVDHDVSFSDAQNWKGTQEDGSSITDGENSRQVLHNFYIHTFRLCTHRQPTMDNIWCLYTLVCGSEPSFSNGLADLTSGPEDENIRGWTDAAESSDPVWILWHRRFDTSFPLGDFF